MLSDLIEVTSMLLTLFSHPKRSESCAKLLNDKKVIEPKRNIIFFNIVEFSFLIIQNHFEENLNLLRPLLNVVIHNTPSSSIAVQEILSEVIGAFALE